MQGITIQHANDDAVLYERALDRCPRTRRWIEQDSLGEYHVFLAINDADELVGHSVIDIRAVGFGPMAHQITGFLEDVDVDAGCRRRGIATALLHAAFDYAWQREATHVRWAMGLENTAAMALYDKIGATFIPESDPLTDPPENYYTVVLQRPPRAAARHG